MNESARNIERSLLWNKIYAIVKEIPRKEVQYDSLGAFSASTLLEDLFLKQSQQIDLNEDMFRAYRAGELNGKNNLSAFVPLDEDGCRRDFELWLKQQPLKDKRRMK